MSEHEMACRRCGEPAADEHFVYYFPATRDFAHQRCTKIRELSTEACRECGRLEREHPNLDFVQRRSNGQICADCMPLVRRRDLERMMKRARREALGTRAGEK